MSRCGARGRRPAVLGRSRRGRVWIRLLIGGAAVWAAAFTATPRVWADAPAVTDFDQAQVSVERAADAWAVDGPWRRAVFITLYGDGRGQLTVRPVATDAVVSFAAEHPCWRLDNSLTLWFHLPVYVREVPNLSSQRSV
ncbi:hypothetical protein [Alicyclobacillus kakegawensis]|uniref:hypothetical protein n=1 Tax=Alicyclobacillus kakegawensis TaxID=392012 RepID=UPI0008369595|nr:hypothetical protein [Alicyclobacillus kakegawensis]